MSMFGALNRFISRLDADPKVQEPSIQNAFGFQVLRNSNTEIAIEPWFDFIIGINGHNIDNADPNLFVTEVRNCAGSNIELGLWSAKGARIRSLWVSVPAEVQSLGLSLQWMPLASTDDVWHVLDVAPNSPADLAGLLPYGDYVIGSPEGLLKGESGLGELVEDYISQPLRLYVYNHEYDVSRLVTIEPSKTWGGNGALGCMLGYGALHRIPPSLEEPPHAPGETLFETARLSSDIPERPSSNLSTQPPSRSQNVTPQYLVPANVNPGLPSPLAEGAGPAKGGRKNKAHHHANKTPAMDMDAYFQEGEEKSREQDHAPSSKSTSSTLPPPPKATKSTEEEGAGG